MELEIAKQLIFKYEGLHAAFVNRAIVAGRYYIGDNDILHRESKEQRDEESPNPLRNADNRVPFNFYPLLVDQKASYLFTAPPLFDVKDDALNQIIAEGLGDRYAKNCKDLAVNASNAGVGWVHFWANEENKFEWGVIPSEQIYPIYSNFLNKELKAVLRSYRDVDDNGDEWVIYELWNDKECAEYRRRGDIFEPYNVFVLDFGGQMTPTNVFAHNLGRVPFIPFANNNIESSDLTKIKSLVDTYDKTFSGFVDDLEDIQQVIFVLTNYGGVDLKQFLDDMKYYKTISIEANGADDRSGVSTLSIDIPVAAREKLLELTRKAIFDMGQGVDPQQQGFDKTSGIAMEYLYSLLELKAGLMETEFRLGLAELVRAICRFHGKEVKQIVQTWTRSAIRNNSELVEMCKNSVGVVSTKTILKNHPFVENADDELKALQEEKDAALSEYENAFVQNQNNDNVDDNGEGVNVDAE